MLASALTGAARVSFLDEQCGSDRDLRGEVESLLEAHEETAGFLERPVAMLGDGEGREPTEDEAAPGLRIGAYELTHEIGRGGMGAVYRAVRADNEFRKEVAIKLIRRGMESSLAVQRFRSERQILARLEHPYIARLIDGGTTPEGAPYFIMEYVEGTPLREFCQERKLPARERLEIYLKVCSAVHYAHRRMIIHRDLKPTNVLVKKDGTPKLLDFGIAKLLGPETDPAGDITLTGVVACTPAYASPEQLRGHPATVRSDLYSLGIMLFELMTGERPPASGGSRLPLPAGTPPDCAELLERGLLDVVGRAIRYEPGERYESVESFAAEIEECLSTGVTRPAEEGRGRGEAPTGSLAVLPFRVLSPDPADNYLGIGITDAIITKLSNVGRISVRSSSSVMPYAETPDVLAAGRELGVEHILEGRVQKVQGRIRVTVQLVRVGTGATAWAVGFNEQFEDLLMVEDSISGQVAQAVVPQLTGEEREHLSRGGTASARAYESYLRGRWHWSKNTDEDRAKALVAFLEAVAADANYARAHAGVADYYLQLGIWGGLPPAESFAAAKVSAQKAIEIDPELAEAHASLGFALWAYDRDYTAASHEFQLAITLNPDYADAHLWFGLLNSCRGRHEMAVASLERACKLSPLDPVYGSSLAVCYYYARRFERSAAYLQECAAKAPANGMFHEILAWNYLAMGRPAEALAEARQAVRLDGGSVLSVCALAHAEAANGNAEAPVKVLEQLKALAGVRYVSSYALASVSLACGRREEALDWLERAWQDHDWWVMWIAPGPRWDALRDEPRFAALLAAGALSGTREAQQGRPERGSGRGPAATLARKNRWWTAAAVVAVVYALAAMVWVTQRPAGVTAPFRQARVTKLTSNGLAVSATMSRDGSRVAYSMNPGGKMEVWVRQMDTGRQYRVAGPFEGDLRGLQFTRNGTHIAFVTFTRKDPGRGQLHLLPAGGGREEQLISEIPGPLSLSPAGDRIAFIRADADAGLDEMIVADLDGANRRRVAVQRYPERFSWDTAPGWSPDGTRLAYAFGGSDARGFYVGVMTVKIADGATAAVKSPRWQRTDHITWTSKSDALFVVGQEQESSFEQIWHLPLGRGEPSRVTNDLSDYMGAAVTSDGRTLLSVQQLNLSNVYAMRPEEAGTARQVTPGGGRYFDLSWSPDGRIVYASDATGSADIWIMNSDGTGQRQLTTGEGRSYSPAAAPDGRTIVFHSNRVGNWNIWRMDTDGHNLAQLTTGNRDSNWPQVTPDGKYVVYHHTGTNAMFNIWRVPLEGGRPVQLTAQLTMHPGVSPKDGRIACWYSEDVAKPSWKVAIYPPNGGTPERIFDLPPDVTPDNALRWTPRGDAVAMIDGSNGVSNILLMPVDGRPGRLLTHFTSGLIYSFDWSRDGRIVFSRGMTTTDVVLIRDESGR